MVPERIGRYEIRSELGRGGMATVYEAYDARFKREVAIKVLPQQFLHDPTFRARFEREAQAIAAIEHPAIVPVYDYGDEDGQPYFVMRFMSGGSLSDRLKHGPISLTETAQVISRLAPALDEMHSHGIIHRDLKPGNILFDHYGNAYLSDFGIARLTEATTSLTGDGIIGTPSYMSPEQARGDPNIDGRSDIYALGAILFEMLTGRQPYEATTPIALAMKHLTEPVPRILEYKADLPPDTEQLIEKAMAKDPNQRFPTAGELEKTIERIATQPSRPKETRTLETTVIELGPELAQLHPAAPPPPQPVISPPPQAASPHPTTAQAQEAAAQPKVSPFPQQVAPAVKPSPQPLPPLRTPTPPPPSRLASSGAASYPAAAIPKPRPRFPAWVWAVGAVIILGGVCAILAMLGVGGTLLAGVRTTPTHPVVTKAVVINATLPPAETSVLPTPTEMTSFKDDFSNPASGWDRSKDASSQTDYDHGGYRIFVDRPNMVYWATPKANFSDVSIEVEATKVAGPESNFLGIICRYVDADNFYLLTITSDGYYSIGKYSKGVFSYIGMTAWNYSPFIHQGTTTNKLRADCVKSTLTLYANDTKLAQADDFDFKSGDVGLTAATFDVAGTNIMFDNFIAQKP